MPRAAWRADPGACAPGLGCRLPLAGAPV